MIRARWNMAWAPNKVSPLKTGIERLHADTLSQPCQSPNKVSPLKTGIESGQRKT